MRVGSLGLLMLAVLLAFSACAGAPPAPPAPPPPIPAQPPTATPPVSPPPAAPVPPTSYVPVWRETATPPKGFAQPNVQWIEIDAPDGYKIIAAVFRPSGAGPFPVVVFLHPGSGFTGSLVKDYGDLLVENGFMVVAGQWFSGAVAPWPTSDVIDWLQGPPRRGATSGPNRYADAIVKTARMLPGADGQRLGLFGLSMGAMASLLLASTGAGVQVVVADSPEYTGNKRTYPTGAVDVVKDLEAPLLMLHGTADTTAPIQEARDYEAALKELNKPYEAKFYEGAPHVVTRTSNAATYADARRLALAFLKKHLMQPAP